MIAMSRLNTTITDHAMITNAIAASLLVSGVIVGTVALAQNGTLTRSYDATSPATQVTESDTTATKQHTTLQTSSIQLGSSTPLSLQTQPQDVIEELQPTLNTQNAGATVNDMQPGANGVQMTGKNPQNTAASLQ